MAIKKNVYDQQGKYAGQTEIPESLAELGAAIGSEVGAGIAAETLTTKLEFDGADVSETNVAGSQIKDQTIGFFGRRIRYVIQRNV